MLSCDKLSPLKKKAKILKIRYKIKDNQCILKSKVWCLLIDVQLMYYIVRRADTYLLIVLLV